MDDLIFIIPFIFTVIGEAILLLAGIWFVRAKLGLGAFLFLGGALLFLLGNTVFTQVDMPLVEIDATGDMSGGLFLTMLMPSFGQVVMGVGAAIIAFKQMTINKSLQQNTSAE